MKRKAVYVIRDDTDKEYLRYPEPQHNWFTPTKSRAHRFQSYGEAEDWMKQWGWDPFRILRIRVNA